VRLGRQALRVCKEGIELTKGALAGVALNGVW
jgi:hypothetical protein